MSKKPSKRNCNAPNCYALIPLQIYFCHDHWKVLDMELQRNLMDAYTPGQDTDGRRKKKIWHRLMMQARTILGEDDG